MFLNYPVQQTGVTLSLSFYSQLLSAPFCRHNWEQWLTDNRLWFHRQSVHWFNPSASSCFEWLHVTGFSVVQIEPWRKGRGDFFCQVTSQRNGAASCLFMVTQLARLLHLPMLCLFHAMMQVWATSNKTLPFNFIHNTCDTKKELQLLFPDFWSRCAIAKREWQQAGKDNVIVCSLLGLNMTFCQSAKMTKQMTSKLSSTRITTTTTNFSRCFIIFDLDVSSLKGNSNGQERISHFLFLCLAWTWHCADQQN